jgi:alpha-glucosidase
VSPSSPRPWWRGGAIYQIYPRSFADANGDGIGDLDGITARLPYVASLGVDAVWLNPIYPSGGADGGYDVIDHSDVDPAYGDLASFDRLVREAHRLGLRVILDVVPNHTSDRHPWFVEARSSPASSKRDWYVFADGRNGGTDPPNNWSSVFFGPSWTRDERSGQWFLTSFYREQPDLDWSNPAVRAAMEDVLRTWTGRGVDGFRIDVIHLLSKDPDLRDNPPPASRDASQGPGEPAWLHSDPAYSENQPSVHDHVREIRAVVGTERLLLGEVWIFDLREVVRYLAPGELDLAFNFPFAFSPWEAGAIGEVIEGSERLFHDVWPAWHLSNHDMPRHATRHGERTVRAAALLLLTLRGTPVLYQGEEIGMADGLVPEGRAVDRMGRDGCRTPMQWDGSANAGFCPAGSEPWLPLAAGWEDRNVAAQEADQDSVHSLYRRLLAARRRHPALASGPYRALAAPPGALAFERTAPAGRFAVAVNLTGDAIEVPLGRGRVAVATSLGREGEDVGPGVGLGPDEAVVVALEP